MQGFIKWFSEAEGLGILETHEGPFCFSLKDFKGPLQEGLPVTFEASTKKISIYDELMPLALSVLSN